MVLCGFIGAAAVLADAAGTPLAARQPAELAERAGPAASAAEPTPPGAPMPIPLAAVQLSAAVRPSLLAAAPLQAAADQAEPPTSQEKAALRAAAAKEAAAAKSKAAASAAAAGSIAAAKNTAATQAAAKKTATAAPAEKQRTQAAAAEPPRKAKPTKAVAASSGTKSMAARSSSASGRVASAWGEMLTFKRSLKVTATGYSAAADENGWGPVDYYGNDLKLGTIAVDPSVIPMGSKVYVTGYKGSGLPGSGMIAYARDQGSAIQGARIDIFIPGGKETASEFGIQDVQVYILE